MENHFILAVKKNIELTSVKDEVENAPDFESIFKVVKRIVEERLGLRRAGLMLIIADAPTGVLAFHEVGSNAIVLNRRHLEQWVHGRVRAELNSYIFVILLHEYLHSLGILDEREVRSLVKTLVGEHFDVNHIASKIAMDDPLLGREMIHGINPSKPREPLIVKDFDTDNLSYIG